MTQPAPLSTLALRVRRAQEREFSCNDPIPAAKARLLRSLDRKPGTARSSLIAWGLVGAAAAAALLVWWEHRPLRYETRQLESRRQNSVDVLRARENGGNVRFSDGSVLDMSADGVVRIAEVTHDGARVSLDRGSLQARIAHGKNTSWSFRAGPFDVAIVGTEFDMRWDAPTEALSLSVLQGAVRLSGCALPDQLIVAGQRTSVRCSRQSASLTPAASATPSSPAAAVVTGRSRTAEASPGARQDDVAEPEAMGEVSPSQRPPEPEVPDWRVLARAGRLKDAFFAADKAGFDGVCASATAAELLDLADAALLAGRVDQASRALMLLRTSHAGTGASVTAAYKLGRLAFDRRGAPGDARTWFETYLREAPGGSLAREAAGRLIEIDVSIGNTEAAKARAREYLSTWPNGPHAVLARRVLEP